MERLNKKVESEGVIGKELYEFQKKQKEESKKREQRKKVLAEAPKKIGHYLLYTTIVVGIIGGLGWYIVTRPPILKSDIVSRSGFHWHPELAIYVKGEKQEIPPNIGIGVTHKPIHTHDNTGVIHAELQGITRKQDIALGRFFKNWGKDMRSFGTNIKMVVNGQKNVDYENYVMRDKDKIELNFE